MARKSAPDALTLFDALVYTRLYRVSIDPPSAAHAWVMQVRHQLRERIGIFDGFYRIPGIAVLEADLPPEYERPIADAVARGCDGQLGFDLRLEGIAHSPDRKVIHIAVQDGGALARLRGRVADHVRANRRIRKIGVDLLPEPRLVIASGLKAAQFDSAWALLNGESFSAAHRVNDLVLLRREWDDTSLDEHVRTFRLGPEA